MKFMNFYFSYFFYNNKYIIIFLNINNTLIDGDWGLGPIPNPQSPIPNPQSPIPINKNLI